MAETAAAPIMLSRHLLSECFASCTRAPRDTNRSTELRSIDITASKVCLFISHRDTSMKTWETILESMGRRALKHPETNGRQVGDK